MESLKQLVEMVASLPNAALWVLGGYLLYQLSILASIYGTIRYVARLMLDGYKHERTVVHKTDIGEGTSILAAYKPQLITQIRRLCNTGGYIGLNDLQRLEKAIDYLLEQERNAKKAA